MIAVILWILVLVACLVLTNELTKRDNASIERKKRHESNSH
jgi:hypothetical protein